MRKCKCCHIGQKVLPLQNNYKSVKTNQVSIDMNETYFFIAGEVSGDLHAARFIRKLYAKNPQAEFVGMGGDNMQAAGCKIVRHLNDMAFMGIGAVLRNLDKIRENFRIAKEQMLIIKPTTLVLIDYPTFNLKMAAWCKKHLPNTCIIYYIPPKVWAWKRWRVHKIGKLTDEILCIFPFEVDFYKQFGYHATYVGNPTLDEIKEQGYLSAWKEQMTDVSKPYIALLPGSRLHEIKSCLPRMLDAAIRQQGYDIVVAAMSNAGRDVYEQIVASVSDTIGTEKRVDIVYDNTYDILKSASAAVVCSGTATLETALIGCPQTAVYDLKIGPLLYRLKPLVFHIPYFTLVNIILDKEVISEWLAYRFTTDNVAADLHDILTNPDRCKTMLYDYQLLKNQLNG